MAIDDALRAAVQARRNENIGGAPREAAPASLTEGGQRLADAITRAGTPPRTPPSPLLLARIRRRDRAFSPSPPLGEGSSP